MTRLFLINGTRTLASLFLVIVLVLGSRQSSYPAEHEIRAILKQPFRIVLAAAIGSTGYSWSARFDEGFLKLEKSWYEKPESKLEVAVKTIGKFVGIGFDHVTHGIAGFGVVG